MNASRAHSATAGLIVLIVLAVGTSASSARNGRPGRGGHPRLIATPARLAGAQSIAPGDRIERRVALRRRGKGTFAAVYLQVRAKQSSLLDSDPQRGLQIAIDRCSRKWRRRGAGYSCPGKRFSVLARRPLIGRMRLKRLGLRHRRIARLRIVLTLPAAADNSLEAQVTTVSYAFVGIARR